MNRFSRSLAATIGVLLAGCNAASQGAGSGEDELRFVVGKGSAAQLTETERGIARLAVDALAADLGIPPGEILVDTVRAVDWPDSSIGCPQPDRAYLQVITPGHKITLRARGRVHVVHEAKGSAFVCHRQKALGELTPERELVFGPQMIEAQNDLASRLGVAATQIKPVSAREHTWDDAALGCPQAGVRYRAEPVKGWVLMLRHDSRDYTYHTDLVRTIPCPAIAVN